MNENFAHIQIEFTINTAPVEDFSVSDSQEGGSACREHIALLYRWPNGLHQIETRVTFTQDINDGWNVYRKGTHVFKYIVSVNHSNAPIISSEDVEAAQTAVANSAKDWDLLLSDNFDNNDNQWYEGISEDTIGTITYDVIDGKYRWSVAAQYEFNNRILLGEPASDFYFTVDLWNGGETGGDFGVTFREDDDGNYYYFAVSTLHGRSCSLIQFHGGEVSQLISWDTCPSLVPNGPNKITIIAEGDQITALINDQLIGIVRSDKIKGHGIGLATRVHYGNEEETYEFDNIELRVP